LPAQAGISLIDFKLPSAGFFRGGKPHAIALFCQFWPICFSGSFDEMDLRAGPQMSSRSQNQNALLEHFQFHKLDRGPEDDPRYRPAAL
jgi:hypothetical protein